MTVATDLQARVGVKRRLVARIDGLNYDLWQPHEIAAPPEGAGVGGTGWRPPLECLGVGDETSFGLSMREMRVTPSGLSLTLDNIYDTNGNRVHSPNDANTNYIFAQWFAPGAASIEAQNANWTYLYSTASQADADATVIGVRSTTGFAASGTAYIGRETFSYSGVAATSFTGVTKGLYPCVGTSWGYTYKYPENDTIVGGVGNDGQLMVADVPYSLVGRRVAIYVTTYDPADDDWRTFAESELLWCGVISAGTHYLASEGKWQLDCDNILKECERPIPSEPPNVSIGYSQSTTGINLHGPRGLRITVLLNDQDNTRQGLTAATFPDGWYANQEAVLAAYADMLTAAITSIHATFGDVSVAVLPGDDGHYVQIHMPAATQVARITLIESDGPFMPHIALGLNSTLDVKSRENVKGGYLFDVGVARKYSYFNPLRKDFNGERLYIDKHSAYDLWQGIGGNDYAYLRVDGVRGQASDDAQSGILTVDTTYTGTSWPTYAKFSAEQDFLPFAHNVHLAAEEGQSVEVVLGLQTEPGDKSTSVGIFEQLLYMLLSTGTSTYNHATYDICPPWISVGMQAGLVDADSFLEADKRIGSSPLAQRTSYAITEATSWMDILQRECKLFGHALVWRNGKLTVRPIVDSDHHLWTETLSESTNAQMVEWPDSQSSLDSIINQWEVKHRYDYGDEKYAKPTTLVDMNAREGLGGYSGTVKIEHPGLRINKQRPGRYDEEVVTHLPSLFAAYKDLARHPWHKVSVSLAPTYTNRIFAGDRVRFQSNTVPDPWGSGSMSCDAFALVLDVSYNYAEWTGQATLLLFSRYETGNYPLAPAAMSNIGQANGGLTGASTATCYIVCLANEFGDAADSEDGSRFSEDDIVRVIDAAQSDPTSTAYGYSGLTVDHYDATNNRLYFKSSPAFTGWDANREHIILPDDWGSVTASQKAGGTWLASASTGKVDTDPPYRWW